MMVALSRISGCRVFRNNVGMGWAGEAVQVNAPTTLTVFPGDVLVRKARPLREEVSDLLRDGPEHCRPGSEAEQVGAVEALAHTGVRRTSQSVTRTSATARPTNNPASKSWNVQNRPAG